MIIRYFSSVVILAIQIKSSSLVLEVIKSTSFYLLVSCYSVCLDMVAFEEDVTETLVVEDLEPLTSATHKCRLFPSGVLEGLVLKDFREHQAGSGSQVAVS